MIPSDRTPRHSRPAAVSPKVLKGDSSSLRKSFLYLLLALTIAALLPRLFLAVREAISYDGYWNIFMDTQNRWSLFFAEYQADQHPILFRFLLRAVAHFGSTRLIFRTATILPGIATVFVIGKVAEKLCSSKIVALLAAAAYGFSLTIIDLDTDIRDYSLALLFIVTAFYFLVEYLSSEGGTATGRSLFLSALFISLGIGTEYYSLFFWTACLVIVSVFFLRERLLPASGTIVPRGNPYWFSIALWLPILTTAYLYTTHLSQHRIFQNNVQEFYRKPGESAFAFLITNLLRDLSYLSPLRIPAVAILLLLLIALPVALYANFWRIKPLGAMASGTPALVLLLLILQLVVLALLQTYPFGGYQRQQSILFPFLTLTCFVFLDQSIAWLPRSQWKTTAVIATALLIPMNFTYWWTRWPRNHGEELFEGQYRDFCNLLPAAQAVYVDQLSLIGYYVHTHSWKWVFDRHLTTPAHLDLYDLTDPGGGRVFVLRDFEWNRDLSQPDTYKTIAQALGASGLTSANIFRLNTVPVSGRAVSSESIGGQIRALAAAEGLQATAIIARDSVVGFHLLLKRESPSGQNSDIEKELKRRR